MAAYSVNQVRQLYVANANQTALESVKNPGDIFVGKIGDKIYFNYMGASKDIMRSDLIDVASISFAKATSAEDIAEKIKGNTITLNPNVNGGVPVPGQEYLLKLAYREYVGVSPADQQYVYGYCKAFTGTTADQLYKGLALSLVKNLSSKINPIAEVYLVVDSDEILVPYDATESYLASRGTATALRVYEAAQPWHLGIMAQGVIPFEVLPATILVDGDLRVWGKVEKFVSSDKVLPEGQKIADLEWFTMGERGDQYRLVGWPNIIPTMYMVDPSKNYDVLTIHYAYQGPNEAIQKSEKDIQIVAPSDTNALNAIIQAINAVAVEINPEWNNIAELS